MASFVDNEYALRFFYTLRNFKQASSMPIKLNASCPVCGDSATDRMKARFWYYLWKEEALVHCYNCDYTSGFGRFLQEQDEVLYREYLIEKHKEGTFGFEKKPHKEVEISDKLKSKMPIIQKLDFCVRLDKFPETHPIIKYVKSRCIPEHCYNRLWFTSNWQELVNLTKETFPHPKTEHRLVIPIFNKDGEIESYQGRALSASAKQKYMTIKAHENASKIYGVDTIDESMPWVFVFEGPLDSLFIKNAIAITGGSLNLDAIPYPDKRIWVMDNEPRHPDTISRMNKLIAAGEKVLFWDEAPWASKDVNDMVKNEKADIKDIEKYLYENWECGMMAQLRMTKYCKI